MAHVHVQANVKHINYAEKPWKLSLADEGTVVEFWSEWNRGAYRLTWLLWKIKSAMRMWNDISSLVD